MTFKQIKLISTDGVLGSRDEEVGDVVILEDFEGFRITTLSKLLPMTLLWDSESEPEPL